MSNVSRCFVGAGWPIFDARALACVFWTMYELLTVDGRVTVGPDLESSSSSSKKFAVLYPGLLNFPYTSFLRRGARSDDGAVIASQETESRDQPTLACETSLFPTSPRQDYAIVTLAASVNASKSSVMRVALELCKSRRFWVDTWPTSQHVRYDRSSVCTCHQ